MNLNGFAGERLKWMCPSTWHCVTGSDIEIKLFRAFHIFTNLLSLPLCPCFFTYVIKSVFRWACVLLLFYNTKLCRYNNCGIYTHCPFHTLTATHTHTHTQPHNHVKLSSRLIWLSSMCVCVCDALLRLLLAQYSPASWGLNSWQFKLNQRQWF